MVGVPKTIDNDLSATDYTFGFDTAVSIATEAIDRLHTTAESHNRVMVLEVMGRHTGWIAVVSGIAGGADVILIPEFPLTVEEACEEIRHRHASGKDFSIVVVSEGWQLTYASGEGQTVHRGEGVDQFGHVRLGGVGEALAREVEERTGYETRVTVLGHVQRGGSPTARDRVLATRFGLKAAELAEQGRFGRMAALRGDTIVDVPLAEAVAELKTVPREWYDDGPRLLRLARENAYAFSALCRGRISSGPSRPVHVETGPRPARAAPRSSPVAARIRRGRISSGLGVRPGR